jgi:cytochrome oxidase Cu insertion factor (SCO1/SenC/PrrC family)
MSMMIVRLLLSFALYMNVARGWSALSWCNRRAFVASTAGVAVAGMITEVSPALSLTPALKVPAPDFDLPNSRGEGTTSLKKLTGNGKWTVLYFYPGMF